MIKDTTYLETSEYDVIVNCWLAQKEEEIPDGPPDPDENEQHRYEDHLLVRSLNHADLLISKKLVPYFSL